MGLQHQALLLHSYEPVGWFSVSAGILFTQANILTFLSSFSHKHFDLFFC